MRRLACLLVVLLILVSTAPVLARTWTDRSGQFQIEAELIAVRNGNVYLEKANGDLLSVPLEKLSEADVRFLSTREELEDKADDATPFTPAADDPTDNTTPSNEPPPPPGVHREFENLGWSVQSLAFSPDGRFLAMGKLDNTILLFDVESSSMVAKLTDLEQLGQVKVLAFSPDGRKLLSGGFSGRIQAWNVSDSGALTEAERFVGHNEEVHAIAVSADGKRVLSGGSDGVARCWTLGDGREQFAIDGFKRDIRATYITRGGKQGLVCDGETLVLIDMLRGEAIQKMKLDRSVLHSIAIAPDGSLVVLSDGRDLLAWEIQSGRGRPKLAAGDLQWSVVFTPNSRYLLSGGRGKVSLWDVANAKRIYEFDTDGMTYVRTLACSADGRRMAAVSKHEGDVIVFQMPAEAYSE